MNHTILGAGYQCGFAGLLHLDVFKQRILDEYGVHILITGSVIPYRLRKVGGSKVKVQKKYI